MIWLFEALLNSLWIGAALGWPWVRNPWFRFLHLGAIAGPIGRTYSQGFPARGASYVRTIRVSPGSICR